MLEEKQLALLTKFLSACFEKKFQSSEQIIFRLVSFSWADAHFFLYNSYFLTPAIKVATKVTVKENGLEG